MGTVDNMYVFNYLVNRLLDRKDGQLMALFMDLRAVYDSVDRRVLEEAMKNSRIRRGYDREDHRSDVRDEE